MSNIQKWMENLQPISDNQLALLSKPTIIVYVTSSEESGKALDLLDQAHAWFRAEPSADAGTLSARWLDLEWSFEGLSEIEQLAKIFRSLRKPSTSSDAVPPEAKMSAEKGAEVRKRIEERRIEQRKDAQAVLTAVRSGATP